MGVNAMKDNDIERVNKNSSGFAIGATPVQEIDLQRKKQSLDGPNKVRYTTLLASAPIVSRQALPANKWRKYLMIQNKSSDDVFIGFGGPVDSTNNNGFTITAGGFYEMNTFPPFNSIFAKGKSTGQLVLFIEGILDRAQ